MSDAQREYPTILPYLDPVLRNEAGEGWHPNGLNGPLFGAILIRESLLRQIPEYPDDPGLQKAIDIYDQRIEALKEVNHLAHPPKLSRNGD